MKKLPPSSKIRKELERILEKGSMEGNLVSDFLKKGMQLMVQELLEAEVTDHLDREHYERNTSDIHRGYRNGYEPSSIKTSEGKIKVDVPQLRDTYEPFSSRLREFLRGNSDVLEKLTAEMYARGLSTRDIEDALYLATGDPLLSKSSVSRVTEILWQEYELFKERDLSNYDVIYLFLDAIYESIHRLSGIKDAILVAWAVTQAGNKVLLSIGLGNKESYADWLEFLRDMVKRGLNVPISITSDGAPGLIRAIDECFPNSLRIRCWVHKMENLSSKVPRDEWPDIKAEVVQIRDAASYQYGSEIAGKMINGYRNIYPSFASCLSDDLQASLNHLKLPARHRKCVRTTNLIERSFVEERRRTKVIPGFWTEKSALKIIFSVLIKASYRWNKIPMNMLELKKVDELKKEFGLDIEVNKLQKEAINV